MKVSVIIPNHRSQETLPRTLRSLEIAAKGLDVETIVSDDEAGNGLPWARNRGLERATGDYVFFVDADDTVHPNYFRHPLAVVEEANADFCLFQYSGAALKRNYTLSGNALIRSVLLPAFVGYSMGDVRRWNQGGGLYLRREPGSVCRVCFHREFLERNHLRFDESLLIYEDAAFLSECALCAERTVSLAENLYNYLPNPKGIIATVTGSRNHWDYKFAMLRCRERFEAKYGGVWPYCEASCVFSALEMMRMWRGAGLSFREFRQGLGEYLSDERVRTAVRSFPRSLRHPLVAAGVTALRCRI